MLGFLLLNLININLFPIALVFTRTRLIVRFFCRIRLSRFCFKDFGLFGFFCGLCRCFFFTFF